MNAEKLIPFEQAESLDSDIFSSEYMKTISMNELYEMPFPERKPVVDNFVYQGRYIFAGAPKTGKSFLMLQIAYLVSIGAEIWGSKTDGGTVLYLSLEDNEERVQKRLYTMFGADGSDNLRFAFAAGSVDENLTDQLEKHMTDYPDTKLIIIDTLQKIRKNDDGKFSYSKEYELMSKLKSVADSYHICILVVHHTRKSEAEDDFERILGSNGLSGAADGSFILTRKSASGTDTVLKIRGRDQPDQNLYLTRDKITLQWNLERTETDIQENEIQESPVLVKVSELVNENNPIWTGTATELVEILDTNIMANSITKILNIESNTLLKKYSVSFSRVRNHNGRFIELTYVKEKHTENHDDNSRDDEITEFSGV